MKRTGPVWRSIQECMRNRIALFLVMIGFVLAASVYADDNVRGVQTKLSDEGFYSGEIDGAYSTELAAALTRYQTHNGLPITGQLDVETSEALGAKPAVGPSTAGTEQSSETWRRLRKSERRMSAKARETSSPRTDEVAETSSATTHENEEETATTAPARQSRHSSSPQEAPPQETAAMSSENAKPESAPPATRRASSETTEPQSEPPARTETGSPPSEFSLDRLHDYVAAFVLAGLDRNVGAEVEFYGDRVDYYDNGAMEREKIREDLKRYDEKWPERHFWIAGKISIEQQSDNRLRVTFPLGFKLRNGNRTVSGKVDKTLVLEKTGDDLQIVAVNERKAERK